MIRFIADCIFLGFFLVLGIPVLLFMKLMKKFNKEWAETASLRIVQWAFNVMLTIAGTEVTVIGEENVPDEPVLFVGNHRSFFDVPLTYTRCKRRTGFVAKKELEKFPLLRDWMYMLYCLFLDRDNIKEGLKTILQAIDYVKSGISIFIFPEGTRNSGEELSMLPFKDGALKIADKSGCAIIPVSLNNTVNIFEAHFPRIKKTHVVIEYGKPIYTKELDRDTRKHLGEYCQNIIQETINKNASLV